jgi:hypothetical protein
MGKKLAGGAIKLSDHQVRILAEGMRMGIPEMIVKLTAIKGIIEVTKYTVQSITKRYAPAPTHFHQTINVHGDLDPNEVYAATTEALKADNRTVKGEVVEEEEPHGSDSELPKVGMDIPDQTRTNGE